MMTLKKLMTMPLARTNPKSVPMEYCMNTSAKKPATVVRLEAAMEEMDALVAVTTCLLYTSRCV